MILYYLLIRYNKCVAANVIYLQNRISGRIDEIATTCFLSIEAKLKCSRDHQIVLLKKQPTAN